MSSKKQNKKIRTRNAIIYFILRFFVIVSLVFQLIHKNYNNVFLCILTLILFMIPTIVDKKLHIELPNALEIIILLFIFSAEILGEVRNFYGTFPHWDTILHTINGFLMAAIGFSLIDILNRSDKFHIMLSPTFISLVAFCFSMTVGVCWEFFEYTFDKLTYTDMQKDKIVRNISSVALNEKNENVAILIKDIDKTIIEGKIDNKKETIVINGGYLDIGLNDTIKDMMVNCVGAIIFSIIGYCYINGRKEGQVVKYFVPKLKQTVNK